MVHVANKTQAKKARAPVKNAPKKVKNTGVKAVAVDKASTQAKKILGALHEARQIHEGKRKGKTFDEFLEEL